MSRLRRGLSALTPYVPGEQPRDGVPYVKLNTNESPYPPSPAVLAALTREAAGALRLYSDPTARELRLAIAELYGVGAENVACSNGSDEMLAFALDAFIEPETGFRTTDITYGFYSVFASLFGIRLASSRLNDDFSVPVAELISCPEPVMLANPNAQTGVFLPLDEVERIVAANPTRLVLIDEAYADFAPGSAIPLTKRYPNLLVIGTFSKSRSLAGARIGFAVGCEELISDLETVRNSFNPYNLNRLSLLAGTAAARDVAYFKETRDKVVATRERTKTALSALGFRFPDSEANFLLVSHPAIDGAALYLALRKRGILVRHLHGERLENSVRITVGSDRDMQRTLDAIRAILEECKGELS